ncbi:HDOD domain-containing protein [Fundidesulfovibrio butyratiphilus]
MELPLSTGPDSHACFLSTTPVFNADRTLNGVAVSYQCLDVRGDDPDDTTAFRWLVSDGLPEIERLVEEHGSVYIPLQEAVLADPDVGRLPWDRCVIEVTPESMVSEDFVDACHAIRTSGYRLAVRLGFWSDNLRGLFDLADLFVLDLSRMRPLEMVTLHKALAPYGTPCMAAHLDTWEDFTGASALGVDLFQGTFFGRPEVVKGKVLQANALARLELMRLLQNEDATFKAIAAVIAKDAFLSYRLLHFVNSPSLSVGREVTSIEHAVTLLGFEPFKQWAMAAVVSSLDASPKGEMLAGLALQRGRFLSNLADYASKAPYPGPKMFLLGLFSLLDAMLDRPMEELVTPIPMDKSMKNGLCGKKSPALAWLNMLDNLDANNWRAVRTFLKTAGIEQGQAAKAYLDATRWARVCFQAAKGQEG